MPPKPCFAPGSQSGGIGRTRTVLALFTALMLGACREQSVPPETDIVRPARIETVGADAMDSGLRFPGRVRAVKRVELAFNVSGELKELLVREGQTVAAGIESR